MSDWLKPLLEFGRWAFQRFVEWEPTWPQLVALAIILVAAVLITKWRK